MTGRDRVVVVALAVCAVLAGAWFGLVSPQRGEAAQLREQTAAARTALDAAVAQATAGAAARRTHARDQSLLARLGKAMPAADDGASLLFQLQDAAGRSRVTITSVSPGGGTAASPAAAPAAAAVPTALPGGVQAVPLTLSFEGSYADLERFLRRIHRFASIGGKHVAVEGRLVSVQSVDLKGSDTPGTPVQANIQALTYLAPPPAPAVDPAAPTTAAAPLPGTPVPPTTAVIGAGG